MFQRIDKLILIGSLIIILLIIGPILINPEAGHALLNTVLAFLTTHMGALNIIAAFIVFIAVGYLAFSKYGKIKLGQSSPEFSTFSWVALIFTATAGSSLVYWGFIEWTHYLQSPPFGVSPESNEAVEWASTYGMFHWGIMGFVIYCFPSLALAYAVHVKKYSSLKISNACRGVLGDKADGWVGKGIDIFFLVGIVGGISTSLGLGTPMLAEAISTLFSIPRTFILDIGIVIVWVLLFSTSAYLGLYKGLKVLSDINVYLYIGFIAFFLLLGPSLFIINKFVDSLGMMFQNFLRMSLYTDSVEGSGFSQDWTIFYWGWWFSYSAFMAMFTARISKGRTIRAVVMGMCLGGSAGTAMAFAVFGNTSMFFELNGIVPIMDIINESGTQAAIVATIMNFPLGETFLLGLFIIFCFVFLATTLDSAAYTLSYVSMKPSKDYLDPTRSIRLFWSGVLGFVTIILMSGDGLEAVQTMAVITGFPIMFIFILIGLSLFKWLREDTQHPMHTSERNVTDISAKDLQPSATQKSDNVSQNVSENEPL